MQPTMRQAVNKALVTVLYSILMVVTVTIAASYTNYSMASSKFSSKYPCSDASKTCVSSGSRVIDGFPVTKDCWEYSYTKTCSYPSKNNCGSYGHCYVVALSDCLLSDSLGNCVNQLREYSCKRWESSSVNVDKVRYGKEEKEGREQLICKGLGCIDGNCVDKSFDSNNEMLDSVSKLYLVSKMKGVTDLNFKLFAGHQSHCSKKPTDYSNCCKLNGGANNWGHSLGANCTKDEVTLIEQRKKNLCVYVGKSSSGSVMKVTKHHWCCFGNILNKVIQVEGRKQLKLSFGSGGSADCRGLTLEEIARLDFDKMDFSEFEAEILKRMNLPKDNDLQARVRNSLPNMQQYKEGGSVTENRRSGVNANMVDDSDEAEEERMMERERQQEERQRQVARQEEERKAELAKEEVKQKQARREAKEKELMEVRIKELEINEIMGNFVRKITKKYNFYTINYPWQNSEKEELKNISRRQIEIGERRIRLMQELSSGNY